MRLALTITSGLTVLAVASGLPAVADADPKVDRVFTAPTAWLPPAGGVVATGTLDLREVFDARLESSLVVGYGLGDLAAVDVGTDTDVRARDSEDADAIPIYLGRASFRLGAKQNSLFPGMPAVLVGFRKSFAASGAFRDVKVAEGYLVASRVIGPIRVHGGVSVIDAGFVDGDMQVSLGAKARPIGALEWTPSQYPNSSLMADITYVPRLERTGVELEWVVGWGVRYQAFPWGAIDLAIRHRQDEELGDSTVMVRLTGVFDPTRPGKRSP